ncbi:hypothetical protein SuUB63_21420 [Streptococcus uberis]
MERKEIANAETKVIGSGRWVAFVKSGAYSNVSDINCKIEIGSFEVTGMAIELRSLPTFFLKKDNRLGGEAAASGMSLRRVTLFG